jgi:hypothetical protein
VKLVVDEEQVLRNQEGALIAAVSQRAQLKHFLWILVVLPLH